ncbi:hypothetical protein [Solicola sp. PLA-1-18]|uniref:hypothetical protein n=1 Tax=Solicola sp. PLA-1-18 TaxID=3380532 RepID=UPI003B7AB369
MKSSVLSARRRALGLTLAAVVAAATAVAAPIASSQAAPNDALCPDAYPAADLTDGQALTGKVTTNGTTPDALTGTYEGTIEDGIAPGVDLLIVKVAGSRVTKADGSVDAGIWAGMSGSPIYASDGRLVGAVSYGFSLQSSDYAGVTPAADLYAIDPAARPAAKVAVQGGLARTMRADGVSAASVDRGLQRLRVPRSISGGLSRTHLNSYARKTGYSAPASQAATTGSRASSTVFPIAPGSAVGTSASYGTITLAGVGTVTAVCGSKVFAFGHPDSFTGPSTLTMHGASPVFIQRDDSAGSYVLANVGAPRGQITQDRTAGILGALGAAPRSVPVTTRTVVAGKDRTSVTRVSVPEAVAFITAVQTESEVENVYDGYQPGTADVSYAVQIRRANGQVVWYRHADRASDRSDVSVVAPNALGNDLQTIIDNDFEDVTVLGVWQTTRIATKYSAYTVGRVQAKQKGKWRTVTESSTIAAKAGNKVNLKVTLKPGRGSAGSTRTVKLAVKIPKRYRGARGIVRVAGLADQMGGYSSDYFEEESDEEDDMYYSSSKETTVTSFPALLKELAAAPRSDDLAASIDILDEEAEEIVPLRKSVRRAPAPVSGGITVALKVRR